MRHNKNGAVLVMAYMAVLVLTGMFGVSMLRNIHASRLVEMEQSRTEAFYLAEAGIQRALWVLSNNPLMDNAALEQAANAATDLGDGTFQIQITDGAVPSIKNITVTGTASSFTRQIQVQARNSWVNKIPAPVYSPGAVEVKFDKRTSADDAYIDGHDVPGIYTSAYAQVKVTWEGEGRISGNPPILENQPVPDSFRDGVWDAFNLNGLREAAKANGTYFSSDGTTSEYNNAFNKKNQYTLPIVPGQTNGVFFFDAKDGEPLSDDLIEPKNLVRVKLQGTTEPISGVIVVVGDLDIKDTDEYDFLFDGVIIVLDDLKIDDKRTHRRNGTNDSDVVIKGAVISDNIIEKGKKAQEEALHQDQECDHRL